MAGRRVTRRLVSRDQWQALLASPPPSDAREPATRRGRMPISRQRIIDAALVVVASGGYEQLTMRSVADALDTGPASLYQHVRDKSELGDLLVSELCSRVALPEVDPSRWREQFVDVCVALRDQFLAYPGVAAVALAAVPADLGPLRLQEALFSLLLAGGADPQDAAWTTDAAHLYVIAYCLEASAASEQAVRVPEETIDPAEIAARLRMLPLEQFPNTVRHADLLTSGAGHERFDFTLERMLRNLGHG